MQQLMNPHVVAIFGGAVSGAEAAGQLAAQGVRSVVFDQHTLPYGKIEDGLPKWHAKLRDKEEANINDKLDHPLISFVPRTQLGRDLDFRDVVENWGFSAVLLATGAWRDRSLPVPGIDDFIGSGLYYQNPFIHWYNHCHEPGYQGARLTVSDGALVIGGGLASIDVAKALMMETVQEKLAEREIRVNMFDLERGISTVLETLGLTLADLGLQGCTLVYRRRIGDMPLFPGNTDTPAQQAKAEAVREKVLRTAQARFLFKVLPCMVPVDKLVSAGRLAGLVLRRTVVDGRGKVTEVPGTDEPFRTPLVISSIGSVPDPLPGVPMVGQTFAVEAEACCRIQGFRHVFALGNAVTGRGNIKESLAHGREVSTAIARDYLAAPEENVRGQFREREQLAADASRRLVESLSGLPPTTPEQAAAIYGKVRERQRLVGYDGDYRQWVATHLPVRLEQLLGLSH